MEMVEGKKGRPRLRIVESDSESEDDVDELSMSMRHVEVIGRELTKGGNEGSDMEHNEVSDNSSVQRKLLRRRNLQRLEEFSWSSSDDESDGNCSISCSSNKKIPEKAAEKGTMLSKKINGRNFRSSSTGFSVMPPSDRKTPDMNGIKSSDAKIAFNSGISLSDSTSSSSSITSRLDDGISLSSTNSNKKNSKKIFSWSFNRHQQEYTIRGDSNLPAFSIPSTLFDKLYDFQKDGVAWMAGLYFPKIGGILGDDMGMGKTYTTLSFLGGLLKAKSVKKVLVVAPVSVLRNWENEAKKILRLCVGINIQVLSSDISVYNRKKKLHQSLEAQYPQLVITSFGLVGNNPDHFTQHVAGKQVWDYVILDEAHNIKNPKTKNSQAVEMIAKSTRTRRLILTGTPIMNNLKEFHTLFTFATSGKVLGTHKDFRTNFGIPIEAARSADADIDEVERGEEAMEELQELIKPYFLQRMKSEYLLDALPSKHEYVLWTNLTSLQREKYSEYIESEHVHEIGEDEVKSPMLAITWLQKLCGHPLLVEKKSVDLIDNFDEHTPNQLMEASVKLKVMYELVNALISKGHRTLIFSQFTKVLDIIQRVLEQQYNLSRIDGRTKEKDRQKKVDEFNEPESDIDIMLISTRSGGQGITLTGADSCIVYDPSWNPAEDAQAVDRCYRLGQEKEVQVFRLITAGTVEEKRYDKQIHKDGIRRTILTNTGNKTAKYFTKEELGKKDFVLGQERECEFLDKLEKRGFSFDETKNRHHSYSFLKGVIGQSSHDVVYSLPELYDDETIQSPSVQPFSSPPKEAKWFTQKSNPTTLGRPQVSKETNYFDNKENKGKNHNSATGKINIVGEETNDKPHISGDPTPNTPSISLEETLSEVENLRLSGRKEQSVSLLMDILDDDSRTLDKDDKSKIHDRMAIITNELGWLGV